MRRYFKIFANLSNIIFLLLFFPFKPALAQTFFPADPYFLLQYEKKQFKEKLPLSSNLFKPYFFGNDDSLKTSINFRSEFYLNNNAPNQENMDVRYFSKGYSLFNSVQFSLKSKYIYLIFEPYIKKNNFYYVENVNRYGPFSKLNDKTIRLNRINFDDNIRNSLVFFHYKGIGFGFQKTNRWWGPGFHSSLQMSNNAWPMNAKIIGTMKEIRFKNFGFEARYSFSDFQNIDTYYNLNKFYTSLNAQLTWYGPVVLTTGFSRNYLSGGILSFANREWKAKDAQMLVFEGFLTSNLLSNEYTIGGHDRWDQTISGYFSISMPNRNIKLYGEVGFNDNRMFLADLISQPDHTMATIIGFKDFGSNEKNFTYGFEWTNLMITYSIRHRGSDGTPAWYSRDIYDYSSYNQRRWAAHSGADSDDWLFYFGYISDEFFIMPSFNYERHGVVSNRPSEVKFELRFDIRYNYKNCWFGLYYENQSEMFLGFPDYFYEDKFGNPIDNSSGIFAKSRKTKSLIFTINKSINF